MLAHALPLSALEPAHTLQLTQIYPELVSFLENLLPPALNKRVEFRRELGHAIAQVLESEVDIGERVGH
jgi:hypothetical protein